MTDTPITSPTPGAPLSPVTSVVNDLPGFLGNADVQKLLGMAQTVIAGATGAEGQNG